MSDSVSAFQLDEMDADSFNLMVSNVDLGDEFQAKRAREVLEAMLVGPPTTQSSIPTRTADPNQPGGPPAGTSSDTTEGSSAADLTDNDGDDGDLVERMALQQLSVQRALSRVLALGSKTANQGPYTPAEVKDRLALSLAVAKTLEHSPRNLGRWRAVAERYPEEEGAPRTLRELEEYVLDNVGAVNVSSEVPGPFYDPASGVMHYSTSSSAFGQWSSPRQNHASLPL